METTTVIENELYRITFSNRGAQVTSWVLKGPAYVDSNGKPLDLVNQQAAKLFGYPLSLYTYDGSTASIATASRNRNVVTLQIAGNVPTGLNGRAVAISGISDSTFNGTYVVTQTGPNTLTYKQDYGDDASSTGGTLGTVNGSTGEALNQALLCLRYRCADRAGDVDLQILERQRAGYQDIHLRRHVCAARGSAGDARRARRNGRSSVGRAVLATRTTIRAAERMGMPVRQRPQRDRPTPAPKKISGGETINGPFDWVGVSDPFFAAVFLPDSPATATMATLNNQFDVSKTIKRAGFSQFGADEGAECADSWRCTR